MPDTGAPWNIPYAVSSDLVRDWPALSEDVAEAVADALDVSSVIQQVVTTTKTDTFTASVAVGAFTAITGLTATITPTSNTNKVLVIASVSMSPVPGNQASKLRLMRAGAPVGVGDAASNRTRITSQGVESPGGTLFFSTVPIMFLDSPATTSAQTYSVEIGHGNTGTVSVYVNRSITDSDFNYVSRGASSITLLEVLA